jgi:superfamily II DNA or RNA helicase
MLTHLYLEYGAGQVTAVNEAVKMSKLVQIACGVVYGRGGEEIVLPNAPRIAEVLRIIEEAHTKTIVFVPYKSVLRYVAAEMEKSGLKVGVVSGDVPQAERARIFTAFQKGDLDALCAQPAAMSHGLTLTAANTVIWYGPTTSNETYTQANARITRPGQRFAQFIVNIEGSAVERAAFRRLKNREKMQGLLLETVEAETSA